MDNNKISPIKKPNVIEHITRDEWEARIKSIARAKRDIGWWAENFFRIVSMDKGLHTIKLYPKQKELLQHLIDNDRSVVLAARQTGKCVFKDTKIKIRNKKTGEIQELPIIDFFNLIANQSK